MCYARIMGNPFAVFLGFRRLREAVEGLEAVLRELLEVQREAGPAAARLDSLELSRFHFEAECSGLLLKAEGKLKAASNAEARERQLKRSYEKDSDSFDEDGEARSGESPILPDNVETGETERMQALHLGLAPGSKALALNHKWRHA